MTNGKEQPSWFERKENITRIYRGVWVICGLLALTDFLYHKHIVFKVEGFPAFYGLYGFIVCVGLVLGAKELRKVLKQDENYYDR
ncbi:MAG: hypothetical protein HN658_08400 [Rhodospirillales bacterium]|jgi:hypothetical protein|nr:hypothetical protein [Rhodospirillales bacterium]MBT4007053.1 hypothetical protein [Rhodospirillales bacterium]MBT5076119.1 hypothetical protein [Rhodospirillales bacterium]MBT5112913.1 hypothetical protein [Rhodospirillales bacterium]MBT5673684.1 hypothetical protein [Rhodospirillales bacterium]